MRSFYFLIEKAHLSFSLMLFLSFSVSSQTISRLDTAIVAKYAQEVYLNCNQYATSDYLDLYKRQIVRTEIIKVDDIQLTGKTINNINSLKLKNKCNPLLKYDDASNFSVENFNPLKYYFLRTDIPLYYKIYGTSYIIKVNP